MAWLHGLLAAVIGGVATVGLGTFTSPEMFQDLPHPWQTLGKIAAGAALFHALAYLKQSPLPEAKKDE